jgi:hypothetical protein
MPLCPLNRQGDPERAGDKERRVLIELSFPSPAVRMLEWQQPE